jgi:predicted Ser/Thr protein kinase
MIGERLGKWVLFKELGRGGMGCVYLAQEELTGRKAALKVLSPELSQEGAFLYRFQREIEILGTLEHPHIVRFYESGCENGYYFYAMEYVEGQSLDEILAAQGRLSWHEVLDIAEQVCPALRHCHDHGVIHRDLKPANLLRTTDGVIKLTDFGIAKLFASTHLTATGGVVGTAEYLSPEQAAGKTVGKRSDLYCLGAVLYALLTGRPPFSGKSYVELLHKHRYNRCDSPRAIVPEIPEEIDEMICQLLEKEPDKRPRDCFVFGKQLARLRRRLARKRQPTQVDKRESPTRAENIVFAAMAGPATLMSRLMRSELEPRRRALLSRIINHPIVLVMLLAACIGTLVWTFWPSSAEDLYEQGARLMATGRLVDMERGWAEYLLPLEKRFPEHPYRTEVDEFRRQLDAARSPVPGEAQRFYLQGEQRRAQGDALGARQVWGNLISVFRGDAAEREWVRRAETAVAELDHDLQATERWTTVRAALDRAARLRLQGKRDEAERIWTGLEELYRGDPHAMHVLQAVQQARMQMP